MRILVAFLTATLALALLGTDAQAQSKPKPGASPQSKQNGVDQKKKKAEDKAYRDALSHIPNANTRVDPWQGVR